MKVTTLKAEKKENQSLGKRKGKEDTNISIKQNGNKKYSEREVGTCEGPSRSTLLKYKILKAQDIIWLLNVWVSV